MLSIRHQSHHPTSKTIQYQITKNQAQPRPDENALHNLPPVPRRRSSLGAGPGKIRHGHDPAAASRREHLHALRRPEPPEIYQLEQGRRHLHVEGACLGHWQQHVVRTVASSGRTGSPLLARESTGKPGKGAACVGDTKFRGRHQRATFDFRGSTASEVERGDR